MSTDVSSAAQFGAGAGAVFSALTSDAWVALKADRLRDGSRVVRREQTAGGGVLLAVSRELPSGGPGFLERFLPADRRVVQTDVWEAAGPDGGRQGTWQVELPGVPARLGGTMRIEPITDGSRWTTAGETSVPLPLVGGKAERFIADMVGRLAAKESELLRSLLSA